MYFNVLTFLKEFFEADKNFSQIDIFLALNAGDV